MVMVVLEIEISCNQMRRLKDASFFFFWVGGFFVFYILNVFPSGFQSASQVPNVTKTFPIAFHF
jgi:hypothetical protein